MKLRRAVFGLRPVTHELLGTGKWPVEEQKTAAAHDGEVNMVEEMLKEYDQIKEKGATLDDLINDDRSFLG